MIRPGRIAADATQRLEMTVGTRSLFRAGLTALASATLLFGSTSTGIGAEASIDLSASHTSAVDQVPCSDPRGCPDLGAAVRQTKIDHQTFSSSDCAVVEGEVPAGKRTLLRFTSDTPNYG